MYRERVILELSDIREKRIAEEMDDEQARDAVIMVLQKFLEDIGFPDISVAIIEAWSEW